MRLSPQKWCKMGVTRHQPPQHHVSAERLDRSVPRHGAAPAPQLPPHTLARFPQHSSTPALRAPCAPALWLWYRATGLKCKKREIYLLSSSRSTQAAGLPCPEPIPVISAAKHRPSACGQAGPVMVHLPSTVSSPPQQYAGTVVKATTKEQKRKNSRCRKKLRSGGSCHPPLGRADAEEHS